MKRKTSAPDLAVLPELGHVQQLVDTGLCRDVEAAERLLAELGVREVQGVFSRRALLAALEGRSQGEVDATVGHVDTATTLREGLARFGLRVVALKIGRTTTASIAATDAPRTIAVETEGAPLLIASDSAVAARVYVAAQRRTGQAYFLAAIDASVALYFFVLPSEGRFWIARREDLEVYDAELRAAAKGQRGRRRYDGRPGFAPYTKRPGYIRVWVGLGGLPGIEPHMRISDAAGRLYADRESWIGGRP